MKNIMPFSKSKQVQHLFFYCTECNYSKESNTEKQHKLAEKLHRKTCKKTGRTEMEQCVNIPPKSLQQFKCNQKGTSKNVLKPVHGENMLGVKKSGGEFYYSIN